VKRRVTFVVDDDERARQGLAPFKASAAALARAGVTVESDEVILESDRVQDFNVRVVRKPTALNPPFSATEVRSLISAAYRYIEDVTVTEVQS
jgi:hypothetical protein